MFEKIGKVLSAMLSANGGISYGRAASLFLMVTCVIWDSAYLVFTLAHWRALFPTGFHAGEILPPVAALLGQVTFFTAPYAMNKFSAPDQNPENGRDRGQDGPR